MMARSFGALVASCATGAVVVLAACSPDSPPTAPTMSPNAAAADRAGYDSPGLHRQYGPPVKVGAGMARTYVVLDAKGGQSPVELGIALDARALEALPTAPGEYSFDLRLPERSPAPYRFAELDWNPQGHPPAGVYTVPHFDFHFYTVSKADRDAIDPSDPLYAAKANDLPAGPYVPPGYVVPGVPAQQAVPHMGVHWFDVTAPELQNLFGNPGGYQPFTKTFIYGSWDGQFIFVEPMVTRAYLLTRPNATTPISVPAAHAQPGWYPTAYRVSYDATSREFLVALTGLTASP
jgi:hypothetical protein